MRRHACRCDGPTGGQRWSACSWVPRSGRGGRAGGVGIFVVSRGVLFVGAVMWSWLFGEPRSMKAVRVSRLNSGAQVAYAALVLAALGFGFKSTPYDLILMGFVTVFTLVSVSLYLVEWVRHMGTIETG